MASAISPDGDLKYVIRSKPFDSKAIIEYLEFLLKEFKRKLLIVWDGASIHDSKEVRSWLGNQENGRIYLVKQPHYSPELNADEQVWNYLKNYKLKNTCNQNVKELQAKIITAMDELKKDNQLIMNFFKHPELGFYN